MIPNPVGGVEGLNTPRVKAGNIPAGNPRGRQNFPGVALWGGGGSGKG